MAGSKPLIERMCADHNKANGTSLTPKEFINLFNTGVITTTAKKLGVSRTCLLNAIRRYSVETLSNQREHTGRHFTINGETGNITQLAKKFGIRPNCVHTRISRGWSVEEALNPELIRKRSEAKRAGAFEFEGYFMTLRNHAIRKGFDPNVAWARYINGWRIEDIFVKPLRKYKSCKKSA